MSQARSPFKFLDSYQKADADVFFGREEETKALYKALSGVKQLLVYGSSGSGKTSLVECGLRNQFSDADWFALTIRRGTNINASVFAGINNALDVKIKTDPVTKMPEDKQTGFGGAVEKLFAKRYQPIYLLFDQFEELLISGETEEKNIFFTGLNNLINYKVPCRIMLIMREEFIGHLSEFEQLCPSIFQHRFRVEKMGRKNVEEVIYHILEAPKYKTFFTVEDSHHLAECILSKLPDKRKEIELAHVQVFLGELWDRAQTTKKNNELPVLSAALVHNDDNLEAVLESFLKKQMKELEEGYGERVPLELLAAMISEKFTKLQLSEASIKADLENKKVISKKGISDLLKEMEQRRIIRTIKVGDETQYEISHDVLALVVGQNLTEEMKMREKASDIYKVYSERQGLFTQDDIDYLRPFEQSLSYPFALQARINESIANIKRQQELEQTRNRKRLRKLYSLLVTALFALIVAIGFGVFANKARMEARQSEERTSVALRDKARAEKERTFELVNFAWTDLSHTDKAGLTDRSSDGFDCKTWLESGFRYLYCKVRTVVSFEKVQSIAGINIFRMGGPHDKGLNLSDSFQFGHYNPEFLTWLDEYLIPQGMNDSRFNKLSRYVYKTHIGPIARAMYHSHEILFADTVAYADFRQRFQDVKKAYLEKLANNEAFESRFAENPVTFSVIKNGYQTALEQHIPVGFGTEEDLQEKFRWLSDYLATDKNDDFYLANTAGGFWVRRSIDGTEAQIFQLLTKLLKTFEPEVLSANS
jgi:hypothetical protein